ncbi:MAG: hypothetical protein FWE05_05930 [Defluviitaleaceae bacterium]|nr:hypothetical protein [Defluviitaleaceae bacterium]
MKSSAKKDPNRFSIRFNPADPKHKQAMAMLDSSGRMKASLIAEALWVYKNINVVLPPSMSFYPSQNSAPSSNFLQPLDFSAEDNLTSIIPTIIESSEELEKSKDDESKMGFDEDTTKNILGALMMFGDDD